MASALKKLSTATVKKKLAGLKGWRRQGKSIGKEFVLGGFTGATRFISKIAPIANRMDHHPDVKLHRYKRVKIILTTHSAGGITQNDFDLAKKIDALPS